MKNSVFGREGAWAEGIRAGWGSEEEPDYTGH